MWTAKHKHVQLSARVFHNLEMAHINILTIQCKNNNLLFTFLNVVLDCPALYQDKFNIRKQVCLASGISG